MTALAALIIALSTLTALREAADAWRSRLDPLRFSDRLVALLGQGHADRAAKVARAAADTFVGARALELLRAAHSSDALARGWERVGHAPAVARGRRAVLAGYALQVAILGWTAAVFVLLGGGRPLLVAAAAALVANGLLILGLRARTLRRMTQAVGALEGLRAALAARLAEAS